MSGPLNHIELRKPMYPVSEAYAAYLEHHGRASELPLRYEDLLRWDGLMPQVDARGQETLWQTVLLHPAEMAELHERLVAIYQLLIADGRRVDYLTVATPPVSFLFQLIAFCYVAAGLGWIGWSIYSYRRKNGFTLVPIELIPGEPRLGEPFTVRLKQPVRFSGMIERLVLEMVLTQVNTAIWDIRRDSDSPDPVLYSTREVVIEAHPVDPDEVLEIGKSFVLPSNLPPSSAPDDHSKFQFIWTLHLRGKSNKRHILKRDYVLDILPSEHRPPKPRLI